LKEHVASIFRAEEKVKQETTMNQVASKHSQDIMLAACFMLVSSTLKMDVTCFSKILVDFQRLQNVTFQKIKLLKSHEALLLSCFKLFADDTCR
jgi:hypothetical protein